MHTGEPVCPELPGPQEQAPERGRTSIPAGVGGAVQTSKAFQSGWCGAGLQEAPRLLL